LRAWKQKGKKEGGLGEGIFALLRLRIERFRFSLIKRNTKQKNFHFLLKEKMAREKNKKCRENFSVLVPPKRSGGGRKRTDLFWILFKKCSNFIQKTPPNCTFCEIVRSFLGEFLPARVIGFQILKFVIRILFKKSSNIVQKTPLKTLLTKEKSLILKISNSITIRRAGYKFTARKLY
jgi:hypothetical protein